MKDRITKSMLKKYREISETALEIANKNISKGKEKESEKIIEMVRCYLGDSKYFEDNNDLINAYGAIYYAHGWIDCGARLKIFNVKDDKLFTI